MIFKALVSFSLKTRIDLSICILTTQFFLRYTLFIIMVHYNLQLTKIYNNIVPHTINIPNFLFTYRSINFQINFQIHENQWILNLRSFTLEPFNII